MWSDSGYIFGVEPMGFSVGCGVERGVEECNYRSPGCHGGMKAFWRKQADGETLGAGLRKEKQLKCRV